MKETSIFNYYAFGYNYNLWRNSWRNKTNSDAVKDIESLFWNVTTLELQVTAHVLAPLKDILATLKPFKADDKINATTADSIQVVIEKADSALDAELSLKKVLSVTPKRFDVVMLLQTPQNLLPTHCWAQMTEVARKDFAEATRCIAMSLSTAAAFHLMRCVEECVKTLYFDFVRSGRMATPLWGPMVEKLRAKNRPKPTESLLAQLDIIRTNYRNPTQHPEKFYTIDEAQDLLNGSIVAISGICTEIKDHHAT